MTVNGHTSSQSTVNRQPSTVNSQQSTVNRQPSTNPNLPPNDCNISPLGTQGYFRGSAIANGG